VKLNYCSAGLTSQCVLCVGGFLRQEHMKFSFVKIENYNTFDMSAFAFSALCTIEVKHSKMWKHCLHGFHVVYSPRTQRKHVVLQLIF